MEETNLKTCMQFRYYFESILKNWDESGVVSCGLGYKLLAGFCE